MTTIKIQCGCGQRYSFDVDTSGGSMPYPIACPICGTDGTGAANEVIAQHLPREETVAVAAAPAVHLRAAAAASAYPEAANSPAAVAERPARLLPGQVPRPQAESEARAKIFWGDSPDEVTKFLMRNNFSAQEASETVRGFFAERAATVRKNGFRYIITGSGMVAVPIVGWIGFASVGYIPLKLFAVMVMVGLYGGWRLLRGIMMMASPKTESGDVADQ
jgi:hypothetical protein